MNTNTELNSEQLVQPIELSFSSIETFNQCPRKYYYNYILKLPKKERPWLVLGTFVHLSLEKFHKYILYFRRKNRELPFSHAELMKRAYLSASRVYDRKQANNPEGNLTDKQRVQAKEILKYHLDKIKVSYPDVQYVEVGFRLKIGDYIIRGFIDRVDRIGENIYEVVDYKTSSQKYKVDKNNQLGIYGYALRKMLGEHIKIHKKLDFIKLYKEEIGTYKSTEDDKIEQFVIESGEKIRNAREKLKTEEEWTPIDNQFCHFCDFKDRCYAQREILF